ncbi:MAG: transglutaminase domain-containing protein [Rhodanobacteraceae bacterium]|nr:transglutaminase domain-containing protein [Rhodanobacteraceae bacterium]
MRPSWLLLLIALWASVSNPALAANALAQTWRAVLFDGRKVGWSLTERETLADGSVRSAEVMDLQIQREGVSIAMRSLEETIESINGEPLSFRAEIRTAGQELRYNGKPVKGRTFQVKIEGAGDTRTQTLELPAHALFFEGQRQALLAGVRGEKSLIAIDAFVPSQLAVVPIETSFKRRRRVELMRDEAELIEVEQLVRYPDGPMEVSAFVDDNFDARRIRMDLAGMQVELLSCDEACAHAPNQPIDFLDRLVIDSPRALTRQELAGPLRLSIQIKGTDIAPARTGHQRVAGGNAGRYELTIDPGKPDEDGEVLELYREPSAWVQSDSVLLQDLARRATDGAGDDLERMRKAEAFVREYIFGKTLSVGYASALEVATTRQGDCTEHALLLAAIARASGIPARVATGLAYVPGFGDRSHVFVPHAWTEAHIDGRWQGFDAALNGFDSGHIALAVGDGDPVRYFAGVALLGRLQIIGVGEAE